MDLTQGINAVMLCFLAVGGADYLLGGRFGLGKEFEEGIVTCGRLLLVMAGFMVLAPLIARGLGPVVSPLFHAMGVDPSILAGMMLANDSGGLPLALELADTQEAGLFSVLIVGSMLGTTVMLGIPTIMMFATQAERPSVIYGLLCGLVTIPLGCLAGGLAAGFRTELVVRNSAPVLVLSVVLLVLLLLLKERIVPVRLWEDDDGGLHLRPGVRRGGEPAWDHRIPRHGHAGGGVSRCGKHRRVSGRGLHPGGGGPAGVCGRSGPGGPPAPHQRQQRLRADPVPGQFPGGHSDDP